MNEGEWLACDDPRAMLRHMETADSDRKMRLIACACVRRVWHLDHDERLERVLLGVENFADGLITACELEPLNRLAWELEEDDQVPSLSQCIARDLGNASEVKPPGSTSPPGYLYGGPLHSSHGRSSAAAAAMGAGFGASDLEEYWRAQVVERERQTGLVRDIFGNPFRPAAFLPEWRTDTAVSLARQMYESRDFSAMPILADALQDAGCDNDDILSHCRDTNATHVRGCWVVDLVLGKECANRGACTRSRIGHADAEGVR